MPGAILISVVIGSLQTRPNARSGVRAVVGFVFLAAVIFHLTMEDPARLRRLRHVRLSGLLQRRTAPQSQEPP